MRRVLGHADGSVTAIYNRYACVREMHQALGAWANELTTRPVQCDGDHASRIVSGIPASPLRLATAGRLRLDRKRPR